MISLVQSKRIRGSAGEALPCPFKGLEAKGTLLRRGQLALVAAGPGTGKSGFILAWALKARVPTLYFSADSDAFTQLTRSISVLHAWSLEDSAKAVLTENLGSIEASLAEIPIRWSFDASPSLEDIEMELKSWFEVYEDYPALVVVDNVSDVRAEADDDPSGGLDSLLGDLHTIARDTQACFVGLHHVTGQYNDADKAIPLSGVKGQVGRVPELIMTGFKRPALYPGEPDTMCWSTVKNRGGKADASGLDFVELDFHGDFMSIADKAARPDVQIDLGNEFDEDELDDWTDTIHREDIW